MALLLLWCLLSGCIYRQQTYSLWDFILLNRPDLFFLLFFIFLFFPPFVLKTLYTLQFDFIPKHIIRTVHSIFHGLTKALNDGITASSALVECPFPIILEFWLLFTQVLPTEGYICTQCTSFFVSTQLRGCQLGALMTFPPIWLFSPEFLWLP